MSQQRVRRGLDQRARLEALHERVAQSLVADGPTPAAVDHTAAPDGLDERPA